MVIGVTDTLGSEHKFQKYLEWLRHGSDAVNIRTLSYKSESPEAVLSCDGLILTGGHDVDPGFYGGPLNHPAITSIDRQRDEFEMSVLDRALHSGIPVLGICRGLQLVNVHFGGSLVPDLEESGHKSHRSANDAMECRHPVTVESGSGLHGIAGVHDGIVNSSHHQAALVVGKGLQAVAWSEDGVVEALELAQQEKVPFFLCVQWHPERMDQPANPLSTNILKKFLSSADVVTS